MSPSLQSKLRTRQVHQAKKQPRCCVPQELGSGSVVSWHAPDQLQHRLLRPESYLWDVLPGVCWCNVSLPDNNSIGVVCECQRSDIPPASSPPPASAAPDAPPTLLPVGIGH